MARVALVNLALHAFDVPVRLIRGLLDRWSIARPAYNARILVLSTFIIAVEDTGWPTALLAHSVE